MTTTAIVIGAGPAGLAAANHLADAGHVVRVLEARAQLGGRASSAPLGPALVNRGPHALYAGGAAARELGALAIAPEAWNPLAPLGSFLLTGPRELRRTPGGPRSTLSVARFLAGVMRGAPVDPALSVTQWLNAALPDPAARATAAGVVRVTSYVADHDAFGAAAAAAQVRLALAPGVRYLGAWQALVDALAARAVEHGVTILPGSAVRAVELGPDGWTVRTDAGEAQAERVVLAPGLPATARRLLGPALATAIPERRAAEAASLDLVLRRLPRPGRRFAFGSREPHYVSVHTPRGDAPVVLTVAAYLTQEDRSSGTRERLEAVADLVQPGWRAELVADRHLPRLTAVPAIPGPGERGRAAVAVPGAPGLALAGDWVGSEGLLLDAALSSGAAAAHLLTSAPLPAAGAVA